MTIGELIRLLSDGEFHSGQQLGEKLGVSRAAVWKQVALLRSQGYGIESVRGKGYKLSGRPDTVTERELGRHLVTELFGRRLIAVATTGSTNDLAADAARAHGIFVHASLYEKAPGPDGLGFNTAILVDPAGNLVARTRKLHIPISAGYYEDTFEIIGRFLDEADRVVRVCGVEAPNELLDDGRTLVVTAPVCETVGCVEVEICTVRGCISDTAGFCYLEPPVPVISGFEGNTGRARNEFVILGENLERERLVVRVCGQVVEHDAPAADGSSIRLAAPDCKTLGWAEVEICTRFGCVSAAEGFFYIEDAATPGEVAFDPGQGELHLSWEPQDLDALHLLGYNLYRQSIWRGPFVLQNEAPLRDASYHDADLTQGAEYCYRIHTVATNGDESAMSGGGCVTMPVYFRRADSNGDGSTDLSDSVYVLNVLFLGAVLPTCMDAADANDDGAFDLSDGLYLLNRLFLGGPAVRAPGIFRCGLDPTEDNFGCEFFPPCSL